MEVQRKVLPEQIRSQDGYQPGIVPCIERHYTVSELSSRWLLSECTIRRLFTKEPGVIKITRAATRSKRSYTTMRIPEGIALRVHNRLCGLN
jgi:hypothetical protein